MRIIAWILAFYPRLWRERYQEEMLALLEQHTITFRTGFDLLLGALDARLDPAYRTKEGFMLQRLHDIRSLSLVYIGALAVFLFSTDLWHQTADALVFGNSISGTILWIGTCSWLVIQLALLAAISGSIFKNACKKRQVGTLLFALICLSLIIAFVYEPIAFIHQHFLHESLLNYLLTNLLPLIRSPLIVGTSLFIIGIKSMKLLKARQGRLLLFVLLVTLFLSAGEFLYSWGTTVDIGGISILARVMFIFDQLTPYMPISAFFLTLADASFYEQQNAQITRIFGILISLILALSLTMIIIGDGIWITGHGEHDIWLNGSLSQGSIPPFSVEGISLLIISTCILAFTYAIVLITLIRSFTLSPRGEDVTERVTT